MAKASDKRAVVRENLIDAGFNMETVKNCMELVEKKNETELLRILEQHKGKLLKSVHKEQEYIDCLDYLVYQIRRGLYD